MALTFRQRFYCKVKPFSSDDECFIWEAHKDGSGYGIFDRKRAHRVAWELECGEIPDGYVVRHYVCNNRACVNVKHLRLGTQQDNVNDMMKSRRHYADNDKIYPHMVQHLILVNQLEAQIQNRRSQKRLK
jgi:HNH endonuclease